MTLKTKNAPFLAAFLVTLYVVFAIVNDWDWEFLKSASTTEEGLRFDSPFVTFGFHVVVLVLMYLLPPDWKHRLIYTRWTHPLPSSRAFSRLVDTDARISRRDLENQYGELPVIPSEQTALWYRIYKSKESDPVVLNSQGRWLFFRDAFSIAIILVIPSLAYTLWNSDVADALKLSVFYLAIILALWICARNTGVRFVCNVLAR